MKIVALLYIVASVASLTSTKQTLPRDENYDEWAVETDVNADFKTLRNFFDELGLEFVRIISEEHMPEFIHLRAKKDLFDADEISEALQRNPNINWVEHQIPHFTETKSNFRDSVKSANSYYDSPKCRCHKVTAKSDSRIPNFVFDAMNTKTYNPNVSTLFNDFRWPCQWQLSNCGQIGAPSDYDLGILATWKKGITGKNMVISVVDDGAEFDHIELKGNYDANASFDFVQYPDKDGPLPYPDKTHGTICAGIVGMVANNGYCGVGVVYEANLGIIRMIGHGTTNLREAASLIYNANYIDVYSNSWGPSDTGSLFRKPAWITEISLKRGTENGRNGKGNIYAFASGNGGLRNDHCGADGFACSIYTIAVASSSPNGKPTYYSEQCTCIMTTVPSTDYKISLFGQREMMIAPDKDKGCINHFSGTSSVTPLAASLFLMTLQSNPSLTWRDVQYLVAETAMIVDPVNKEWQINGAGFHVHPYYGFGAINALRLVSAAENWDNIDIQRKCLLRYPRPYRPIPSNGKLILRARTKGCQGSENEVLKLEHIQVIISYDVKCRGDISVQITSPCGTVSKLMNTRKLDANTLLVEWPFMSVFHWGEDPRGEWTLEIQDNKGTAECERKENEHIAGHVGEYHLVLWGVASDVRRNLAAPYCSKLNRLSKYTQQSHMGSLLYEKFLKSMKAKPTMKQREIFHEFVEDFSENTRKDELKTLKRPTPPPTKHKPYSLPFQRKVMDIWRRTFPSSKSKSIALADFIVSGKHARESMSSRQFAVLRHLVANRINSFAENRNDDGKRITRTDLPIIARDLLGRNHARTRINAPQTQLRDDVAAVLYNLRQYWE